ncbi:MAG: hypothetical protein Q9214_002457 [Letrouitia sp. 1 TL-2023]
MTQNSYQDYPHFHRKARILPDIKGRENLASSHAPVPTISQLGSATDPRASASGVASGPGRRERIPRYKENEIKMGSPQMVQELKDLTYLREPYPEPDSWQVSHAGNLNSNRSCTVRDLAEGGALSGKTRPPERLAHLEARIQQMKRRGHVE